MACFFTRRPYFMETSITYPSILRRFMTIVYDSLLVIAVSITYGLIYMAIAKSIFDVESDRARGVLFQLGWLLTVVSFYSYFWMKGGQTTGMRAWRIKIIGSKTHEKPKLYQCLLRLLFTPIGWGLFCSSLLNSKKQFLHDLWSGTELILLPKESKK